MNKVQLSVAINGQEVVLYQGGMVKKVVTTTKEGTMKVTTPDTCHRFGVIGIGKVEIITAQEFSKENGTSTFHQNLKKPGEFTKGMASLGYMFFVEKNTPASVQAIMLSVLYNTATKETFVCVNPVSDIPVYQKNGSLCIPVLGVISRELEGCLRNVFSSREIENLPEFNQQTISEAVSKATALLTEHTIGGFPEKTGRLVAFDPVSNKAMVMIPTGKIAITELSTLQVQETTSETTETTPSYGSLVAFEGTKNLQTDKPTGKALVSSQLSIAGEWGSPVIDTEIFNTSLIKELSPVIA